jgi:peptidoglycan/xylan/chitin deacetylase (PgdA/CDA1 family)
VTGDVFANSPIILFNFDDSDISIVTGAYPILSAAGYKATVYVNTNAVGTAGHLSTANLITLYNAGWDLGNHSMSHVGFDTLTYEEQLAELVGCTAQLNEWGFSRAASHFAYPLGVKGTDSETALRVAGIHTARYGSSSTYTYPISNRLNIPIRIELTSSTTLQSVKDAIDAGTYRNVFIILCHTVTEEAGEYGWSIADYTELVNYVATKGLTPMTISELYST